MSNSPEFPSPVRLQGRLYWSRTALENYKRELLGLAPLPIDPQTKIELVPATEAASEFGFGRRTLGRRIKRDAIKAPSAGAAA